MIHSYVFGEGRLAGSDLDLDALRLVRKDKGLVMWVDLDCPTTDEARDVLETLFGFHPLAIEDCLSTNQLPKLEDYEEYLYIVMHAVDFKRREEFKTTEIDIFVGKDFLVTHHTVPLNALQQVQQRITRGLGKPVNGADRLAHMVLDVMTDQYVPISEELTSELEELEDNILSPTSKPKVQDILAIRQELSDLRRIVRPQREVVLRLSRGENKLIRPILLPYFRDLHDHLARIDETTIHFTERLMMAFDVYMNRTANEANESIKILTAITALTFPPMLVGGWYGMNFEGMPELHSQWGYWGAIGLTVLLTTAIFLWLRRKKML